MADLCNYQAPHSELWQGRHDPGAQRYFQKIMTVDLNQAWPESAGPVWGLLGFACDEGVVRNQGRRGAAAGPDALRRHLAKLCCGLAEQISLWDCGTVVCPEGDLEAGQKALGQAVSCLRQAGVQPLVMGGGHETAYGHYLGLVDSGLEAVRIVNCDAHFDLRPVLSDGAGSSGSPFTQIAERQQQLGCGFDYLCLGIQPQSNHAGLYQRAEQLGSYVIEAEAWHLEPQKSLQQMISVIKDWQPLYVSLCLDVLSEAAAPGVSAPQPLGLDVAQVLSILKHLASSGQVAAFDMVELAPGLDQNEKTSRLAAQLMDFWLRHWQPFSKL